MKKDNGFTLIEVLLSLSIVATLLFFTLPFESFFYKKNQAQVIQSDIQSAVRYAKTHALAIGENVILTPLQGSTDWSLGMLMLVDNAKHGYTSNAQLIHEWHWKKSGVAVSWRGFQSKHYLLFAADPRQNSVNGSFLIKTGPNYTVKLLLNKLGRIRIYGNTSQDVER